MMHRGSRLTRGPCQGPVVPVTVGASTPTNIIMVPNSAKVSNTSNVPRNDIGTF